MSRQPIAMSLRHYDRLDVAPHTIYSNKRLGVAREEVDSVPPGLTVVGRFDRAVAEMLFNE